MTASPVRPSWAIGAELTRVEPGRCEIVLPYREALSQQHGFFHGGVIATIADNASGYAAYSLMPADASVLTVELKLNLLAPGAGEALIARAQVERAGRTLTVVDTDVFALNKGQETKIARMLGTFICLHKRSDGPAPAAKAGTR